MECIVCKNHQRDVMDIQRKIAELTSGHGKIMTAGEKEDIRLVLTALAASKSEIEGRYLKHRKSPPH
jgi:hypothetical protein